MMNQESIEAIKEILEDLLRGMGIKAELEVREQAQTSLVFNIRTEDSHILIGQHGVNLSALQYICRVITKRRGLSEIDFVVDVDDYKKKHEQYLSNLAERAYREAVSKKAVVVLRPMSSYERRVVHALLTDRSDVLTDSIGEEPSRMVAIRPIDYKAELKTENIKFPEQS